MQYQYFYILLLYPITKPVLQIPAISSADIKDTQRYNLIVVKG